MLVIGPISSLFDFLTFYVLLAVLQADEKLFQTGWFVESLCTQVLVIFVIRTRGNPLKSRAHPLLTATSLAIVAIAVLLPLTPPGTHFGFVPPPARFYLILGVMVVVYLFAVELAKRAFYRWSAPPGR
jgi:Mg2+-importing ATPase